MSDLNIYRCTPRQVRKFATQAMEAGLVPFIQSSPGAGKSSIARFMAKDFNLKMIDHRLSTSAPEDLSGLPRFNAKGRAEFAPFEDLFPLQGTPIPQEHNGWMLFLDEFNSASKAVQGAAYKLILDRMTGQHKLHDNVAILAAGNLATDRAIVNPISTAMQSRFVNLEMVVNFEEWLEDVAIPNNYDSRIIAYLNQYPSKLMDFRPDHQEKTFCCPRTWEFMNALVSDKVVSDDMAPLFAGTITSGVAVEFIQFTKVFANMISIAEILRDPLNCPVPQDNSTKWAVITHMMEKVDLSNFKELTEYTNRFDVSFRILFFRYILIKNPEFRNHPSFTSAMVSLSKYLHGA